MTWLRVRHTSVEHHKPTRRATSEIYANTLHLRDLNTFTGELFRGTLAGVRFELVLIRALFPCQGLLGANVLS